MLNNAYKQTLEDFISLYEQYLEVQEKTDFESLNECFYIDSHKYFSRVNKDNNKFLPFTLNHNFISDLGEDSILVESYIETNINKRRVNIVFETHDPNYIFILETPVGLKDMIDNIESIIAKEIDMIQLKINTILVSNYELSLKTTEKYAYLEILKSYQRYILNQ